MSRISPWVAAPPLIFAAIAATFFIGLYRDDPDSLPSAMIGKPTPQLVTTPIASLSPITPDLLAEPAVKLVNFWASWCAPCRAEHPNLMAIAAAGIPIVGLNYKDSPANALKFLAELGNPFTAVSAIEGRAALDWGVYGVPETFIVAPDGTILARTAGPVTRRVLEQAARQADPALKSIIEDRLLPALAKN
jgi:cytochrome c biogenesis protein CcmG/thiol:disulfide interchange protein DsbE